jgi:hypothetical protein
VLDEWFPNHKIEASTRETYTYLLNLYILREFENMQMRAILPLHIRQWILKLEGQGWAPRRSSSAR